MAQKFIQLRYFGEDENSINYNNVTFNDLISDNLLDIPLTTLNLETFGPIVSLGVRALPGTKFYINALPEDNSHPIIVGHLGIFELDFTKDGIIKSLRFDKKSVNKINESIQGGYLIIDMLGKGDD